MPISNTPKPPAHLSASSRAWFAQIISDYELESQHVRLLTLCCEAADRATLAREALAKHGLTYLDRFGAPHARPEVAFARDATIAVARLCRELDLDADAIAIPTRSPALNSNRPLTDAERACLIGDRENDGFTLFAGDADYLPNLWRDHGDHVRFGWKPGMLRPEMREAAN